MRTSNVLFTCALAGSLALSAWLWLEWREERAINAGLMARMTLPSAPSFIPSTVARATPVAPVQAASVPVTNPSGVANPPEQADAEDLYADERRFMRDPKYRDLMRERYRLSLATNRDNFIRVLGFTPAQADAVVDLEIASMMNWVELPPVPDPMTDGFRQIAEENRADSERAYQEGLRKVLGEQKRVQLQEFMESQQTRLNINHFRAQLSGADSLREDQVEPLIAAAHEEEVRLQREAQAYRETLDWDGDADAATRRFNDRILELTEASNRRMQTAVAPILSPSQLDRFMAIRERNLALTAADQNLQRLQSRLN